MANLKNTSEKMWKVLCKSEDLMEEQFWKSIDTWNHNSHTINRRIHSVINLFSGELENCRIDLLPPEPLQLQNTELITDNWCALLEQVGLKVSSTSCEDTNQVFVKKLLPRNTDHFKVTWELVILGRTSRSTYFCSFSPTEGASLIPKFPYRIRYDCGIVIEIPDSQNPLDPSAVWLQTHLLIALSKWAHSAESFAIKSHTLISKEKYLSVYQTLKKKYGQQLVKMWPECTDPVKFVHEDVAIASYLILLWEGIDCVSFVDLGCGNGLLVHILNSEGHKGLGIDVRDRKIWKLYPVTTKLEVRSITPSDGALFPEVDWLIGNHSDELTPWIPVIAARSSQTCKFFVLPCCPYDFDGLRYRRKNSSVSQYTDFLDYLRCVSEGCGFKTYTDRLRIPSTKRICLVGQERTYSVKEWSDVNSKINRLIENGCRKIDLMDEKGGNFKSNSWVDDFKPRESKEAVRNCTQLDRTMIDEIVSLVADYLLVKRRILPPNEGSTKTWNAGGIASIGELIPLITVDKLKKLKSEFGGLQTLLKNNHQVFLVQKGKVQLRPPISLAEVIKRGKIHSKYKPCWFHNNHPDGCLLSKEECAFVHR